MKVSICVGSSCHLKGSRHVIERLQTLVAERDLSGQIELSGNFCTGNCQNGVCVTVDDDKFSITPETVDALFENEILGRI